MKLLKSLFKHTLILLMGVSLFMSCSKDIDPRPLPNPGPGEGEITFSIKTP